MPSPTSRVLRGPAISMRRDKSILETMIDKENAKLKGKKTKEGGLHKDKWVPWHIGVADYRRKFNGKND